MDVTGKPGLGRRALLAAGAAGVAAAAAQAIAAPAQVLAIDAGPVMLGQSNEAGSTTTVRNTGNSGAGLVGRSFAAEGVMGVAAAGDYSGVYGYNTNAKGWGVLGKNEASGCFGKLGTETQGVFGISTAGEGVAGHSATNHGIEGSTDGADRAGVYGLNTNAQGLGVLGDGHTGVYGLSASASGFGVKGENTDAHGPAVFGFNEAGKTSGALAGGFTALYGKAPLDLDHRGLYVEGRAAFTSAGTLTIARNRSSGSVVWPAIAATTTVLATLQANRPGVYVQAAVAASGKITIYLNKKVAAATKVAYFVLD